MDRKEDTKNLEIIIQDVPVEVTIQKTKGSRAFIGFKTKGNVKFLREELLKPTKEPACQEC